MSEEITTFEGWCIVELMGHNVIAGYCTEQVIAGTAMLRVDVPAVSDVSAYTKYFASSAIYGITPVTEDAGKEAATRLRVRPISLYILPEVSSHGLIEDDYEPDAIGF